MESDIEISHRATCKTSKLHYKHLSIAAYMAGRCWNHIHFCLDSQIYCDKEKEANPIICTVVTVQHVMQSHG